MTIDPLGNVMVADQLSDGGHEISETARPDLKVGEGGTFPFVAASPLRPRGPCFRVGSECFCQATGMGRYALIFQNRSADK